MCAAANSQGYVSLPVMVSDFGPCLLDHNFTKVQEGGGRSVLNDVHAHRRENTAPKACPFEKTTAFRSRTQYGTFSQAWELMS